MGAETLQIFASNPRGWKQTSYTADQGQAFQSACREAGIGPVWVHMMYLASYGTPDTDQRQKSIEALAHTLASADTLGAKGVVTHMGSHKGLGFEQALSRITDSYTRALEDSEHSLLIMENSAGAGGNVGNSLVELATMLEAMKGHPRMAVCIDTAHALTSGYDIRTRSGLDDFLAEFDRRLGLDRLAVMHLNDSKADLGTHIDRHENIGDGAIGKAGFEVIVNHPKLKDVCGILEVPGIDGKSGPDQANLDRLKALTHG